MTTKAEARAKLDRALGAVEVHLRGLKSVNEVTRDYQNQLERLVVDAANGNVGVAEFRLQHNTLIDELAEPAFVEGLREGGGDPESLDREDEDAINEWRLDQFGYVLDFAKAAVAVGKIESVDERTAARQAILDRVEIWVGKLKDLGSQGYARAKEGEKAYWELGETEVHCKDCLHNSKLKPKRMGAWLKAGKLPRSKDLECTGLNCDCTLKSVKTGAVLYPVGG